MIAKHYSTFKLLISIIIDYYTASITVEFIVTRQSTAEILQSIIIDYCRLSITVQQDFHALLQILFRRRSFSLTATQAESSSIGVLPPGCVVPCSTPDCLSCNPTKMVANLLQVRVKVTGHSEFDILVIIIE
jgi:hypothetical protein